MKKNNKHGFTLAELLIVVAIIAVLTAIAIPVFSTQLEKSRQATDLANIRAAYAEAMTNALSSDDGTGNATSVPMTSVKGDWSELSEDVRMGDVVKDDLPTTTKGETVTVYISADGSVSFTAPPDASI